MKLVERMIQDYIDKKSQVIIFVNNELDPLLWVYSVQVKDTDFWLDTFDTKAEAVSFCEKKGLPYETN